tara:strand:- start:5288 stop:5791 length:504 start_codon:yes stop_codon:yes gene_type:complete
MTVRRITIEYEDGTSEVLTPAEWMGVMLGARSGVSSVSSLDNTTGSDFAKKTFQSAQNLVSAVEEEEIAVQIEPLPEPFVPEAPGQFSVREIEEAPIIPPADDADKTYRQATVLRFPFGKYKGKTILELVLDDSEFAAKCMKQLKNNGKHRELANAIRLVLEKNPGI